MTRNVGSFDAAIARMERREDAHRDERRRARMAAIAVGAREQVVELMADDANAKVRRTRKMDAIERAFRRGFLRGRDDLYRVARCLEADFLSLLPPSGGLRLERMRRGMSESFVLMPGAPGVSTAAPQAKQVRALQRLRIAAQACGEPGLDMLRSWIAENMSMTELARARRMRLADAPGALLKALELVAEGPWDQRARRRMPPYQDERWRVDVLAEAV